MLDFDTNIFKFILCGVANEAWTKIDNGARIWNKHPITIIEEWYSDEKHSAELPQKTFNLNPRHVATFKNLGILPDADGGSSYTLSPKTAGKWVKALGSCLNDLVTHLSSPPLDCTSTKRKGKILDLYSVNKVDTAMSILKVILHYKIFQHLISPDSLVGEFLKGSLKGRYPGPWPAAASEDSIEEQAYEGISNSLHPLLKLIHIAVSAERDDEPIHKHVTRYLESMILPRKIADALLRHRKQLPLDFKFDMIIIEARPPPFPNANNYYQRFKDKYIEANGPKAESYIKKHESPLLFNESWTEIHVHAEAALMGVACASDSKSKEAQAFMEVCCCLKSF